MTHISGRMSSYQLFYRHLFLYCSLWKKYTFLGCVGFLAAVPQMTTGKNAKLLNCQSGIQLLQCIYGVEACVGMKLP